MIIERCSYIVWRINRTPDCELSAPAMDLLKELEEDTIEIETSVIIYEMMCNTESVKTTMMRYKESEKTE